MYLLPIAIYIWPQKVYSGVYNMYKNDRGNIYVKKKTLNLLTKVKLDFRKGNVNCTFELRLKCKTLWFLILRRRT